MGLKGTEIGDVSIRIAMKVKLGVLIRVIHLDIGNFVVLLFERRVLVFYVQFVSLLRYWLIFGDGYVIYPLRRDPRQGGTAVLPL